MVKTLFPDSLSSMMRLVARSKLWGLWLSMARPVQPNGRLRDPFPGEAGLGQAILDGRFHRLGNSLDCGPIAPWRLVLEQNNSDANAWLVDLYAFDWLRHLAALDDDAARRRARQLLIDFWTDHADYDGLAWRGDILAKRLLVLTSHAAFLQTGADDDFRQLFKRLIARQYRHLAVARRFAGNGLRRFDMAIALMAQGIALDGRRAWLGRGLMLADQAARQQILGDGGHVSRNPSLHVDILERLAAIRDLALSMDQPVPQQILSAIDRVAPMIRFFRHDDGRLALFHGGDENSARHIDAVLARSGADGKPVLNARHAGYQRLEAGDVTVIADFGAPPQPGSDHSPHASTLAFEMTSGKYRLITQCGAGLGGSAAWRRGLRSTPAHSTLSLAYSDSSEILPHGKLGRRRAEISNFDRHEDASGTWIRAAHNGWLASHGLLHQRQLYLDSNGSDLRGEDRIMADSKAGPAAGAASGLSKAEGMQVMLRFHLHPNVEILPTDRQEGILLRLPGGPGWRLTADGAALRVEDSIYCGRIGEKRPAKQICLDARLDGGSLIVNWSLSRLQ